jgi:hypothetical protein
LGSRNRFLDDRLQLNLEAFHWKYRDHQEPRVAATSLGIVAQPVIPFKVLALVQGVSTGCAVSVAPGVYTSGARDPFTAAPYFAGSIQNPRIYGARFKVNF